MGSVNEEITRIAEAKAAIEEAIEYCGVDVPDGNKIDTYSDYIREIPEAVFSQFTVPKVGDDDTYIKYISQTNGKISAKEGNTTSDVEANSVDLITSGGVYKEVIKYLPLSGGGKMTGPIIFNGSDSDRYLIRVNNGSYDYNTISTYGFTLKYLGQSYNDGVGVNNVLALYADNSTNASQNLSTVWLNDGNVRNRTIEPHLSDTFNLGSSSLKWKNIYATTFTGHLAGTVSMTGGTDNAYRNILVTNGSNGICYSSAGNVQLNYATGDVKATSFTGNVTGNLTGTSDIAKTLPHFKISSNSQLPTDGSPEYVKFATITIPTSAWSRKSVTLFFQDYEANAYQGDILTIQASSNKDGIGSTPQVKWVTKYQNLTIDSIIISKISDNVYDLYLEAKTSYITLRVFYLTTDDVGTDKTFNFVANATAWSTTAPNPITSRSTLKNVASELGNAKTLWGQSFDGTANVRGDMTGVGSITMSKALKINGSNADTANLHFGRTTYNYISSPSGSTIHVCPGGITKDSTHGYVFGASEFYPGTTNTYNLGSSSLKWANVYATTFTGNVVGNAATASSTTKLTTARMIYGQSFDGTDNITGNEKSIGFDSINAIDSDPNNWVNNYSLKLQSSNNAMTFMVDKTDNGRKAMIQVGHAANNYAKYLGELHLNPLGGKVIIGINGTTDPALVVSGNVTASTFIGDVTGNVSGSSGSCIGNAASATNATNVYINTSSTSSYYPMTFVTTAGAGNKGLYIDGSTDTSSASTGIRYNPSLDTCYCSGGFYEASDERLKNFGDDIEVDLDKLSKLSKKYFTWKGDKSNTQHIGISAQEIQELYPELVEVIDEEGHLSVSYDKLSVVALKGIDILNDKIKSLEARLEKLEKLIYK